MIENYTCPNCGAPLNYNGYNNLIKCEYCSSITDLAVTEEERQIRLGISTASKVKEYKEHLLKTKKLRQKITEQSEKYNNALEQKKNLKSKIFFISSSIVLLISFLIIFWLNDALYFYDFLRVFLEIILIALTLSGAIYLGKKIYKNALIKITVTVERENALLTDIQKEFNQEKDSFDIDYIDEKYRRTDALDFIISSLEKGRAFTLYQAENLWDDKNERNELKNKLDNLSQSNNNNKNSATTIAVEAATVVGATVLKKAAREFFRNL